MTSANWVDRALGVVAPGFAARRAKARARRDAVRAYAGAATGRHTDGWTTAPTSANAEIAIAGQRLRDRANDLVRNNPHAANGVSVYTADFIGHGITPRANTGDEEKNKRINAAFAEWARKCDADGQLDFYGMQTFAVRQMVVGGEVIARRRWRRAADGMKVPVQIQVLEGDYIDSSKANLAGSNRIVSGIEFDSIGRRRAYWLYREHPGDSFAALLGDRASSPVVADDIAHIYEKQRNQARGVTWFAPVIRRIRDADDYDFAEGIRKKLEASHVGVVIGDGGDLGISPDGDGTAPLGVVDKLGNIVEKFAPGMFSYLRGGTDIKFNSPAAIGGYEDYKRVTAREIAAGLRIPYEYLTGDMSNVNFSSARVRLIAYRRFCEQVQWQILVPMMLEPWWRWFCEAAYVAGVTDSAEIPVEWDMPKWQAIEPYKDAMADLINLRIGGISWPEMVAARGRNPDDVLNEIISWNEKFDAAGIVFDGDPRKVTMAGVMQKLMTDGAGADRQT